MYSSQTCLKYKAITLLACLQVARKVTLETNMCNNMLIHTNTNVLYNTIQTIVHENCLRHTVYIKVVCNILYSTYVLLIFAKTVRKWRC